MSDQFVAEIRMFSFNFAPNGWAACNGQLLPISQNTALFSLVGTNYGGNGTTNFGLPNLQGITPLSQGQGLGLTERVVGEVGGEENVTLLQQQMPLHTHSAQAAGSSGQASPTNNIWGSGLKGHGGLYSPVGGQVTMNPTALSVVGGSQPHNNQQPYLTVNFCIAMQGIFPARS